MPSTITVQQVLNVASTYTELIPLAGVGGVANEPGLTIANETMNELLGEKMPWKFNRAEMPSLFTMRGRQNYKFAGASAFTLTDAKGVGIDLVTNNGITESGNTVTVKTLDPHNFIPGDVVYMTGNALPAYNSAFTQTPDSSVWSGGWTVTVGVPGTSTFQFTHASSGLATSGASGITDFGWIEAASMVDPSATSSPQGLRVINGVRMLEPCSTMANPTKVCILQDLGTGVLRIRFNYVPGSNSWQVNIVYQSKATLLTSLSNTWAPFPDELAYVYRQMFIAQAYRFANSPRSEVEYQKAQANIMKGLGGNDREQSDEYMVPESPIDTGNGLGMGWSW